MSAVDEEGKRRRLPPWMLGSEVANRVPKCYRSNNVQKNSNDTEEAASKSIAANSAPKRAGREKRRIELENSFASSVVVVKCEKEKRGRIVYEDDEDGGADGCRARKQKKRKNIAKRKRAVKSLNSDNSGDENSEVETDEMDLTVEDCLAIAQEYVDANERPERRNGGERRSQETPLPSTNPVIVEPGTDFNAADTGNTLPTYEAETPYGSSASLTVEAVPFSGTGDPAQDMLDLFLGPLLRKPKEVKNKDDYVTERSTGKNV